MNGTFDVDSWGTSANAIEKDYSHAVTGSLISSLSGSLLNEFRFQWAKECRPRPYNGPDITGQSRPLPDTAFDFGSAYRFGMPFFIPVDYFDQRIQFNDNLSVIKGRHAMKFGVEFNRVNSNQTFRGFQNGRYIFGSTDGFLNYAQNPQLRRVLRRLHLPERDPARRAPASPARCSSSCSSSASTASRAEEAGTQDIPQTELAIFAQDKWQPSPQPDRPVRPALGDAEAGGRDHAGVRGLLCAAHRADGHECLRHLPLPVQRRDHLGLQDVPAARRHLLGPQGATARRWCA